jgi:hypothetical protein
MSLAEERSAPVKERAGVVVLSNAFTQGGVEDIGIHVRAPM